MSVNGSSNESTNASSTSLATDELASLPTGFRALGGNVNDCFEHCWRHSIWQTGYIAGEENATLPLDTACRGFDWDPVTQTCWWYRGEISLDTVAADRDAVNPRRACYLVPHHPEAAVVFVSEEVMGRAFTRYEGKSCAAGGDLAVPYQEDALEKPGEGFER